MCVQHSLMSQTTSNFITNLESRKQCLAGTQLTRKGTKVFKRRGTLHDANNSLTRKTGRKIDNTFFPFKVFNDSNTITTQVLSKRYLYQCTFLLKENKDQGTVLSGLKRSTQDEKERNRSGYKLCLSSRHPAVWSKILTVRVRTMGGRRVAPSFRKTSGKLQENFSEAFRKGGAALLSLSGACLEIEYFTLVNLIKRNNEIEREHQTVLFFS